MSNFTKGEWYVNNTGPHWSNPIIDNYEICCSEEVECVVDHVYGLADANLIAAAPDMYAILSHLLKHDGINDTSIEQEVRCLLEKARGE